MTSNARVGIEYVADTRSFSKGTKAYIDGLNKATNATQAAAKEAGKAEQQMQSFSKVLEGIGPIIGISFGVATIGMIARTTFELGRLGAQAQRTADYFKITSKYHQTNSEEMLAALTKASRGTISQTDLMRGATRAMEYGLSSNAEKLGKLMEVTIFRSRQMGVSVDEAWNRMIVGIGRKSKLILDDLMKVDIQMGDTSSEAEIMAEIIRRGAEQIAASGGTIADSMESYEVLDAKLKNIQEKWATMVALPVTTMTLNLITTGLEGWESAAQSLTTIKTLTGLKVEPDDLLWKGWDILKLTTPWLIPLEMAAKEGMKDSVQEGLGEGIADVIKAVVPDIGNAMETQMAIPVVTMQDQVLRLAEALRTMEPNTEPWYALQKNMVIAVAQLHAFGADANALNLPMHKLVDLWSEDLPFAIRHILWQMIELADRQDIVKTKASEYAEILKDTQFTPNYAPQFQMEAWLPDYAKALRQIEAAEAKAKPTAAKTTPARPTFDPSSLIGPLIQPSGNDWIRQSLVGTSEAMGDAWDEEARRWADVAARGKDSPWAAAFKNIIPPDIMDEGGEAIKAFGTRMQQEFYNNPLASADPAVVTERLVENLKQSLQQKAQEKTLMATVWEQFKADPESATLLQQAGIDVAGVLTQGIQEAMPTDIMSVVFGEGTVGGAVAENPFFTDFAQGWANVRDETNTYSTKTLSPMMTTTLPSLQKAGDAMLVSWESGFSDAAKKSKDFNKRLGEIKSTWDSIEDKTVTLTIKVKRESEGDGAQYGANFVVPPGYPNDTFPLRVTSGERVVVIPRGQPGNTNVNFGGVNINNGMDFQQFSYQVSRVVGGGLQ